MIRQIADNWQKIFKKLTKISLVIGVFIFVINLFFVLSKEDRQLIDHSQDHTLQKRKELYKTMENDQFKTKEGKIVLSLYKGTLCALIGEGCTEKFEEKNTHFNKSLFGSVAGLMIMPFTSPPASGTFYVYDGLQNAGFIPSTYAAEGIGFASLRPFLKIWTAFRDVAYLVLVLIIIAIGFMIMFQYKLNPQTIVSIENALPKIVITLLLITFSFAIAGFLVDLTYLIILFIFEIFASTKIEGFDALALQNKYLNSSIIGWGFWQAIGSGGLIYYKALMGLYSMVPAIIQGVVLISFTLIQGAFAVRIGKQAGEIMGFLATRLGFSGGVLGSANVNINVGDLIAMILGLTFGGFIAPLLLWFIALGIVLIGLLFLFFRIFFLLIGAYVQIIIQVMFAPLLLLTEAIPGQNSFAQWIRRLFGHLIVFPTVILLLLVIEVIQNPSIIQNYQTTGGAKPFSMPLLFAFDTNALTLVISGVLLFAIPDLVKSVVKRIAGESPIQAGAGMLFGGAAVAGGTLFGLYSKMASLKHGTSEQSTIGKLIRRVPGLGK